jgi:hypothetical protein
MAMFISPSAKVPVTLDGNTIYIKAKMDAGTKAAVQNQITATGVIDKDTELSKLGAYSLALLEYNIVSWEGPAFVDGKGMPIPCNKLNIGRLDLDEPLIVLVREQISERNKPKEKPESADPN